MQTRLRAPPHLHAHYPALCCSLRSSSRGSHLPPSWRTHSQGSLSFVSKDAVLGTGTFISVSRTSHYLSRNSWLGKKRAPDSRGSLQRAQPLGLWHVRPGAAGEKLHGSGLGQLE